MYPINGIRSRNIFVSKLQLYKDTWNVYGIPADDILHIHGKFTKDNELDANAIIVGHGASVKEIDEKFGNDDDEMTKELKDLVNHFRKDTSKIISDNADFWSSLKDVNDVYVFGHSMADVDLPYFKKVKESIKPDALWHISVYKEGKISVMKSYVIDKLALSEDKVCVKTFTEFCKRGWKTINNEFIWKSFSKN